MIRSLLRFFASGLLMGGADIIPGVSGGTMALIVGVYERLVAAVSSATSLAVALVRLDFADARQHVREIPWILVLPLGAGIVVAGAIGARTIPPLMDAHPQQMNGLFLGLVAASLVIPALRIDRFRPMYLAVAIVFGVVTFFLVGLPVFATDAPSLLRVFGSAAIAICAMILPGISGAFLLKAMGIYEPTLEALNGVLEMNAAHLPYVLTFCAGAASGLGAFAKVLDWLLEHRHDLTMAALLGLIAGALRALWPYVNADGGLRGPVPGEPILPVIGLGIAGFAAVIGLIWWSRKDTVQASVE
ncbi:hypothetical protein CRI94_14895 [Longibacter salinarum]|uniref:DUF368 domain-containing protein n=1 Tax=Longibacter salinarum TaxID=1850348 RepID=A0A2A8CUT4_9BACT|nr:DUF368 domain-containing protein [Longibacter salinarum]PEN12309.1 hypothetical protein CRI94_14895 [Longibacter salinarum]